MFFLSSFLILCLINENDIKIEIGKEVVVRYGWEIYFRYKENERGSYEEDDV